jgi:hypothetical protein
MSDQPPNETDLAEAIQGDLAAEARRLAADRLAPASGADDLLPEP